jgi:hypothetical protein
MTARKSGPDWERIRLDWCTDKFTLRELTAKHGPSPAQICKRAKKEGWQKDLTGAIKTATKAAVQRETVNAAAVTDAAMKVMAETVGVVAAAAEVNKQVILQHRSDVARQRALAQALQAELEQQTHDPEVLRALLDKLNEDATQETKDEARKALRAALNVHGRINSLHKLADTTSKHHAMERKAFGLDDEDSSNKGSTFEEILAGVVQELPAS